MLPAPVAIAVRTLADWFDDRLTIAAIGLATGYFGLGDAQWGAISNWIVGTATLVLVLVPDPRRLARESANAKMPPIELVARTEAPGAERGSVAADGLRQSVQADPGPGTDTESASMGRPNSGWGDQ